MAFDFREWAHGVDEAMAEILGDKYLSDGEIGDDSATWAYGTNMLTITPDEDGAHVTLIFKHGTPEKWLVTAAHLDAAIFAGWLVGKHDGA